MSIFKICRIVAWTRRRLLPQSLHRFWRDSRSGRLFVAIAMCFTIMAWSHPAMGQIPGFGDSSTPTIDVSLPVRDVIRYGGLEVTWVESPISDKKLFQIASPMVLDRRNLATSDRTPVEVRASQIEDLLWLEITCFREIAFNRLLQPVMTVENPNGRLAQVVISTLKNLTAMQISNAVNSRPLTIATITTADTDFY